VFIDSGRAQEGRVQLELALKQAQTTQGRTPNLTRLAAFGDRKAAVAYFANAARLNQGDPNAWAVFASALVDINRHAEIGQSP
jgi:hypothetical protein